MELEEKIIDFSQKNSQAGAGLDSMFSLIEGRAIFPAKCFEAHIRRVRGYSRNARRGVTDEYSLKAFRQAHQRLQRRDNRPKKSDDIIDTRAADGFNNMSSEILIPFGVYLLLFSIFSSEIQSSRIKSFGITKQA